MQQTLMVDRKVYIRTKVRTSTEVGIGLGYGVEILPGGLSIETEVYLYSDRGIARDTCMARDRGGLSCRYAKR